MPDDFLEQNGYALLPPFLDNAVISDLLRAIQEAESGQMNAASERVYALRNLLEAVPAIRKLAASRLVRSLVEPYLGAECFAVRALYFDKIPSANWKVPYHQDISIALAEQKEVAGFDHWTHKEGALHAYAPDSVLENMLTVRLHLDACKCENGALRVLPGSHRHGRLNGGQVAELRGRIEETVCAVEQGGALLMRPLLLHASSSAESPEHRRVVHIEYANALLSGGLEWRERVGEAGI